MYININRFLIIVGISLVAGCGGDLDGEGPAYYTTAFQCDMKHSDTGWCFSTPTKIFSSDYKYVGKGAVQDYIIPNGQLCVANANGCISVNVAVKDRN